MKKIITPILIIIIFGINFIWADIIWTSGYHEISDINTYNEIWTYNHVTVNMLGGKVTQLGTFDTSRFNMFGGEMNYLLVHHNSIVNIYGGSLSHLIIYDENGLVNLSAYNVIYHFATDKRDGRISGNYFSNDQYFTFDIHKNDISHVNIIPEPTTILLFGFTGFLLKRKFNKK